jgi:hypothetical protein
MTGRDVCYHHGGKTPRGEALPQTKHMGYSRSIPRRLASRYEEAIANQELHDLRHEIGVAETMIADRLEAMEHKESDRLWVVLRRLVRALEKAEDQESEDRILVRRLEETYREAYGEDVPINT